MQCHPASIEEKLGFDVLRARLEALVESTLGADRLEALQPAASLEVMRARLERVAELRRASAYDAAVPLRYLDVRPTLRRTAPEGAYVEPEALHALRLVLAALRRTKTYFEQRAADYPRLAALAGDVVPLEELEAHIRGLLDAEGRLRDDASPELARLRVEIRRTQEALRETLLRTLRMAARQGHATEEQPTIRGGRMVIPVRAEAKRKVEGFVHDTSASGQTVYIEPAACLELNNEVRALQSAERREVERILRAAADAVRAHLASLRTNVHVLARFDLLQARARLAERLDAHVPELTADGVIDLYDARNPVLLLHVAEDSPDGGAPRSEREQTGTPEKRHPVIPLDLTLGEDARTLVITGPNAGGKTVAMKTVGLFALMLAYGLPIPAAPHTRFSFFEKLLVDIGDEQSIEEDLSTFSSHVANLRFMVEEAGPCTLILIDEAGTGTDPAEGGALAQAVLERLTEREARTIATTHHGTLKAYAHEAEGAENGSMAFDQETLRPTYRFRSGVPGSSYAFEIAERIGLPATLLARARSLAGERQTALEDLIAEFEARSQALARRRDEARSSAEAAEKERAQYEGKIQKFEKERTEIRRQALEEAERIVQGANARIERVIREIREAEAEQEATRRAREAFEDYREEVEAQHARADRGEALDRASPAPEPEEEGSQAPVLRRDREQTSTPGGRPGPIEEGDQVVVDGGRTAVEVLEIEGGEAVVAQGAMRMRVALDRLTSAGGRRAQRTEPKSRAATVSSLDVASRIDLRGERVEAALQAVERLVDEAVAAGLSRVEILHGKGTGALRAAVHDYLAGRDEVARFEEAPLEAGGAGVTYVWL